MGVDECVLSVRWSEPVISCAGSVSQYVLSVTPPISDCQSGSEDCVFMTDQTQYSLTVTASQIHSLTVRADNSFGNNILGQPVKNVRTLFTYTRAPNVHRQHLLILFLRFPLVCWIAKSV